MRKYKMWDKKEDIYTLGQDSRTGKGQWTAEEYMEVKAQWAKNPNAKVVVAAGDINGMYFGSFRELKYGAERQGLQIPDNLSDDEVLNLIEEFQDRKPTNNEPGTQERIAAALEYQNLIMM